ncbi:hypothetical protein, partial [Paramuribaculum intestinale]|uniref:hypothetical protein n=2 Tax=Paramuribaculum intestinale TaxID=2094151 RepID=UPI0025B15D89
GGSDGTESRRQRRQPIRQEERGKRRHRESETEAAAHPAGGEREATAQRVGDRGGSPSGREERGKRGHRESEAEAAMPYGRR